MLEIDSNPNLSLCFYCLNQKKILCIESQIGGRRYIKKQQKSKKKQKTSGMRSSALSANYVVLVVARGRESEKRVFVYFYCSLHKKTATADDNVLFHHHLHLSFSINIDAQSLD